MRVCSPTTIASCDQAGTVFGFMNSGNNGFTISRILSFQRSRASKITFKSLIEYQRFHCGLRILRSKCRLPICFLKRDCYRYRSDSVFLRLISNRTWVLDGRPSPVEWTEQRPMTERKVKQNNSEMVLNTDWTVYIKIFSRQRALFSDSGRI
jgi:hypothetical protein